MITRPAITLLGRASIEARALVAAHPPRLAHANKKAVYELACPAGAVHGGSITVSRWAQTPWEPARRWCDATTEIVVQEDVFGYAPSAAGALEWHVNFAHTILFVAYGGPLFAQDEMQVAEHPALGSVREWLTSVDLPGLRPVTRESGVATPILLRGVERRCRVATDVNLDEDRVSGLYGNSFGRARVASVRRAVRVIDPPTVSNLLAMEAPNGGSGGYTRAQLVEVLATAYTGFCAVREESVLAGGAETEVAIHTGHWGTGAYGGDRVLMAALQLLAARAAGLTTLVFHTVDERGSGPVREAMSLLKSLELTAPTVDEALDALAAAGFVWGHSDGN